MQCKIFKITSERIKDTQSLFDKSMALIREMVLLHIELAQLECQQFSSGQKEALELATKSSELEAQVRQYVKTSAFQDRDLTFGAASTV
jgi:hypothetical protein